MRKCVAGGRRHTKPRQGSFLEVQAVANIIEPDGIGELGKEHCCQMAGDCKGSCFESNLGISGMAPNEIARNQVENLFEDDFIIAGWCLVLHFPL
jgi:hypothetical protein